MRTRTAFGDRAEWVDEMRLAFSGQLEDGTEGPKPRASEGHRHRLESVHGFEESRRQNVAKLV